MLLIPDLAICWGERPVQDAVPSGQDPPRPAIRGRKVGSGSIEARAAIVYNPRPLWRLARALDFGAHFGGQDGESMGLEGTCGRGKSVTC